MPTIGKYAGADGRADADSDRGYRSVVVVVETSLSRSVTGLPRVAASMAYARGVYRRRSRR